MANAKTNSNRFDEMYRRLDILIPRMIHLILPDGAQIDTEIENLKQHIQELRTKVNQ
jgi:hypothetical protein